MLVARSRLSPHWIGNQVDDHASLASFFPHPTLHDFLDKPRGQVAANAIIVEGKRGWIREMLLPTHVEHQAFLIAVFGQASEPACLIRSGNHAAILGIANEFGRKRRARARSRNRAVGFQVNGSSPWRQVIRTGVAETRRYVADVAATAWQT